MGKRPEQTLHQRWQTSTWKDVPYMSLRKCNWKQPWDTTAHLSERPKSRTLTTPNIGKDVQQQKLSFFIGRNTKWLWPLWHTAWQSLMKLNILLPYDWALVEDPLYLPKGVGNSCPHKSWYMDVYCIINNEQNLEATKMSFSVKVASVVSNSFWPLGL